MAGAAVLWRRTVVLRAALTAYYGLVVVILMNGRVVLAHFREFGAYSGAAERLAIIAGGLIIYSANADIDNHRAADAPGTDRVRGLRASVWRGALRLHEPNRPAFPSGCRPRRRFWGYATGVGQIAAALAMRARLAAHLLTAMYASFTLLVQAPMLLADPTSHFVWTENALNLALIGVA